MDAWSWFAAAGAPVSRCPKGVPAGHRIDRSHQPSGRAATAHRCRRQGLGEPGAGAARPCTGRAAGISHRWAWGPSFKIRCDGRAERILPTPRLRVAHPRAAVRWAWGPSLTFRGAARSKRGVPATRKLCFARRGDPGGARAGAPSSGGLRWAWGPSLKSDETGQVDGSYRPLPSVPPRLPLRQPPASGASAGHWGVTLEIGGATLCHRCVSAGHGVDPSLFVGQSPPP
jgi:hypothetical protein